MDLKINRNDLNSNLEFDIYDNVIGNIKIEENQISLFLYEDYLFKKNPKSVLVFKSRNNIFDYINTYSYSITKGKIKGKILDFSYLIDNNIRFEVFDIESLNSKIVLKGSIIKKRRLNRKNILIEFVFDNDDIILELKDII